MLSAQFQLHAEIEQRHWWFVARRRILRRGCRRNPAAFADDDRCRRRLRHWGQSGGAGGRISVRRDRHVGRRDPARQERFPQTRLSKAVRRTTWAGQSTNARLVLLMDVIEHVPDDFAVVFGRCRGGATRHVSFDYPSRPIYGFGPGMMKASAIIAATTSGVCEIWHELPIEPMLVSHFNRRLYPLVKGVRAVNRWRGPTASPALREPTSRFLPSPSTGCLKTFLPARRRVLCRAMRTGRRRLSQRRKSDGTSTAEIGADRRPREAGSVSARLFRPSRRPACGEAGLTHAHLAPSKSQRILA